MVSEIKDKSALRTPLWRMLTTNRMGIVSTIKYRKLTFVIAPTEKITAHRMPRTRASVVEDVGFVASYGISSIAANAFQAKRESATNAAAQKCASPPAGYGPRAANTHTLAIARYSGFNPIRSSKNRQQATKNAVNAVSVIKHFPAASHDANGPHGRPNNVMTGGRKLTIAVRMSCAFPDQKALLTATDLHR